jgi:hypothetical protein
MSIDAVIDEASCRSRHSILCLGKITWDFRSVSLTVVKTGRFRGFRCPQNNFWREVESLNGNDGLTLVVLAAAGSRQVATALHSRSRPSTQHMVHSALAVGKRRGRETR